MKVALTKIVIADSRLRDARRDAPGYQTILNTMSDTAIGQINAISVEPFHDENDNPVDDKYLLVDGSNRFHVAAELGWDEIEVLVSPHSDPRTFLIKQIVGNAARESVRPYEYVEQLHRIVDCSPPHMALSELATDLGMTTQRLKAMLKMRDDFSNPVVIELINSGQISLTNALALGRLPATEHADFLEASQLHNTDEFARAVAARCIEIKEATSNAKTPKKLEFKPCERLRKISDINIALKDEELHSEYTVGMTPSEAFKNGLRFAIQMDSISVQKQKEKYDDEQLAKKRKKEDRAAQRKEERAKLAAENSEAARQVEDPQAVDSEPAE